MLIFFAFSSVSSANIILILNMYSKMHPNKHYFSIKIHIFAANLQFYTHRRNKLSARLRHLAATLRNDLS